MRLAWYRYGSKKREGRGGGFTRRTACKRAYVADTVLDTGTVEHRGLSARKKNKNYQAYEFCTTSVSLNLNTHDGKKNKKSVGLMSRSSDNRLRCRGTWVSSFFVVFFFLSYAIRRILISDPVWSVGVIRIPNGDLNFFHNRSVMNVRDEERGRKFKKKKKKRRLFFFFFFSLRDDIVSVINTSVLNKLRRNIS